MCAVRFVRERSSMFPTDTVRALVRLCIAPGCAVAFRGPREACPCCGGPSKPAPPCLPQPERGAGALCRECAHRGACPPGADLRRVTSGGEADDECCWEYQPNAAGQGAAKPYPDRQRSQIGGEP